MTTEEPVFVTVEPASTAKLFVVPSGGAVADWSFVFVCPAPLTGSSDPEHEATTAKRRKSGSLEAVMGVPCGCRALSPSAEIRAGSR